MSRANELRSGPPTRPHGRSNRLALVLFVAALAGAATSTALAAARIAPTQRLAVLRGPHTAFVRPDALSAELGVVRATRPLTGERTVLPIIGEVTGKHGAVWLDVRLPGRPNGHTGWIRRAKTRTALTWFHLVVELGRRRVSVYYDGVLVRVARAVVGKPSTPTPTGQFFVEESVALGPADVGAPSALALSARSDVLQAFDGGPGQIALHGVLNVGGVPGTAVSHGCIRLTSAAIRWLAERIEPGVPVTIIA